MGILEWLVERGYRGIAYRLVYEHESQHGSMEEVERYDVAALMGNVTPRRFTYSTVSDRYRPMRRTVSDEKDVTQAEYDAEIERLGGIKDTQAWHVNRARAENLRKRLDTELERAYPVCPLCGERTVIKYRGHDKKPFFSCGDFPKCRGSLSAHPEALQRIISLLDQKSSLTMR
ncbi:MAG: hypothetical protein V1745_01615 [Patescibacteria group bacterium]